MLKTKTLLYRMHSTKVNKQTVQCSVSIYSVDIQTERKNIFNKKISKCKIKSFIKYCCKWMEYLLVQEREL